jgi:hypothetical protein
MNGKQVTPRQRLASVMGKCFETQPTATRDELRHAVLSHVLKREIKSSADMTDKEVQDLLTLWEHWQSPFNPSDAARLEINAIAKLYQSEHGQTEMTLA